MKCEEGCGPDNWPANWRHSGLHEHTHLSDNWVVILWRHLPNARLSRYVVETRHVSKDNGGGVVWLTRDYAYKGDDEETAEVVFRVVAEQWRNDG